MTDTEKQRIGKQHVMGDDQKWYHFVPFLAQNAVYDGFGRIISNYYAPNTALAEESVRLQGLIRDKADPVTEFEGDTDPGVSPGNLAYRVVGTTTGDIPGENVGSATEPVYIRGGAFVSTGSLATVANLTDGSVTKLGKNTVGSVSKPIFLDNGVPTVATSVMDIGSAQTVTGQKTFNAPLASAVASPSNALVTKAEVYGTGKSTNNLLHNIGNERAEGEKQGLWLGIEVWRAKANQQGRWVRVASVNGAVFQLWNFSSQGLNNGLAEALFAPLGAHGYNRYMVLYAGNGIGFAGKLVVMRNTATNFQEIWYYKGDSDTPQTLSIVKGPLTHHMVIDESYDTLPTEGYGNPQYIIGSA